MSSASSWVPTASSSCTLLDPLALTSRKLARLRRWGLRCEVSTPVHAAARPHLEHGVPLMPGLSDRCLEAARGVSASTPALYISKRSCTPCLSSCTLLKTKPLSKRDISARLHTAKRADSACCQDIKQDTGHGDPETRGPKRRVLCMKILITNHHDFLVKMCQGALLACCEYRNLAKYSSVIS